MVRGLCTLMRELQSEVARQSARESADGRTVKVWVHGHHRLLLTPDGGFFIVLLRPPPNVGGREVKLLFGFRDLYLLGFEHGDLWYVFSDAKLGAAIAHPRVRNLGFDGGYRGNVFQEVKIAVMDLLQTYQTLLDAVNRPCTEVYRALYGVMVTISEALRSVEWMKELVRIYKESRMEPAVDNEDDDVCFSQKFRNWSNRSKAVREGENAFVGPQYGFNTYDALLANSGVVLSR